MRKLILAVLLLFVTTNVSFAQAPQVKPCVPISSVICQDVTSSNPLPVTGSVVVTGSTASDGSTTITLGGTAQNLFSGATPINGWWVANPDAVEDCWVSDSTTAAANATGSMRLSANGGNIVTPVGYKPFSAVSILCATTGHKITARKW